MIWLIFNFCIDCVICCYFIGTPENDVMTYQHVQVERGKQSHYCFDEQDLKSLLKGYPANASYNIQRFKGLIHLLHLLFEHK